MYVFYESFAHSEGKTLRHDSCALVRILNHKKRAVISISNEYDCVFSYHGTQTDMHMLQCSVEQAKRECDRFLPA